ncbi:MAG: hypothetical protein R3C26_07630 [Calditrichia bacterium]
MTFWVNNAFAATGYHAVGIVKMEPPTPFKTIMLLVNDSLGLASTGGQLQ